MTETPNQSRPRHKHEFSGLWWHYGPYGPQDVHLHGCFEEDCDRTLVAEGRECGGSEQPHFRFWLGDDIPAAFYEDRERREAPLRFYEAAH
jgi:hypothetical protein